MKKITIILPIYQLETEDVTMLNNALYSAEDFHNDVKILLVCPEKLRVKLENLELRQRLDIIPLYNTTPNTDFVSQVNMGIANCDTEWFSILEIDDEYKKPWLSSMDEYMKAYPDVNVFLPIVKEVNVEGKFLGFMNDSLWAYGFSGKQGVLDNEILLEYQNYQTREN